MKTTAPDKERQKLEGKGTKNGMHKKGCFGIGDISLVHWQCTKWRDLFFKKNVSGTIKPPELSKLGTVAVKDSFCMHCSVHLGPGLFFFE